MKIYFIYVLKLVGKGIDNNDEIINGERFYVGSTNNFITRLHQHNGTHKKKNTGSVYVTKYKPFVIEKIIDIKCNDFWDAVYYENIITLYIGSKYGYHVVAGGNFVQTIDLNRIKSIKKALMTRTIIINKKILTIDRIDIVNDFINKKNIFKPTYDINDLNLGTGETEHQ